MAKNIKKRVEKVETTEDGKFFTATILGAFRSYVLDIKNKVFCRKQNQLHFPMDKGLTVPK